MLNCCRHLLGNESIPWSPGRSGLSAQTAAGYIARFAEAEREALLGIFEGDDLVALAELAARGELPFQAHRCSIAPGVLKRLYPPGGATPLVQAGEGTQVNGSFAAEQL